MASLEGEEVGTLPTVVDRGHVSPGNPQTWHSGGRGGDMSGNSDHAEVGKALELKGLAQ